VWSLATKGLCQAVWNWISLGGSEAATDDNAKQEDVCLDVRGLQCFGDTLKIVLLECSLSCGSG